MKLFLTIACLLFSSSLLAQDATKYFTDNGTVKFRSDAPLEIINASSHQLTGVILPGENTFAFNIKINSFEGFNSSMQQVYFNENYMESDRFQTASFTGRIIEKADLSKAGIYTIRAKGKLNVHGVQQERIIKCTLQVEEGKVHVQSKFSILLDEHGIRVPKIIRQKIAGEIFVSIDAELEKRQM